MNTTPLPQRPAWKALAAHHKEVRDLRLRELFAKDPSRGERMSCEACGLYLDYFKNRITDRTLHLLGSLANEADLDGRIKSMFRGERINTTEDRAVLHVALRPPHGKHIETGGRDVVPEVHEVLDRCAAFAEQVHKGA
jgi:glucose-6-phosphate isomerase